MNYKKYLEKLFLEAGQPLPSPGDPNDGTHNIPQNSISGMLDQDTDPDQFLTQGIKDTFDGIQRHFDQKMSEFANTLNPETAKNSTLGQLKEKVKKVSDFTNKIQVFTKAKVDNMSQDPYAFMAQAIARNPTNLAAFEELHKNLEEFQKAFEAIDSQIATVHSKIEDFISDSTKGSQGANAPQPQVGPPTAGATSGAPQV